jgi:hypothetical protein
VNEHLTDDQLAAFRERRLCGQDLFDADGHLGRCRACRRTLLTLCAAAVPAAIAAAGSPHLTNEELKAYVEGDLVEVDHVYLHLDVCRVCREKAAVLCCDQADISHSS